MHRSRRWLTPLSLVLAAIFLLSSAGCQSPGDVYTPFPITSSGAYNAVEVHAEQDTYGNRHILWEEEDPSKAATENSRLSYAFLRFGKPAHILSIAPPAGYKEYLNPSFGMVGGQIWMVWQRRADSGVITHCFAEIGSGAQAAPDCLPLDNLPGSEWEPPKLVTNGTQIYAAWVVTETGQKHLKGRDFNGASSPITIMSTNTTNRFMGPALGINKDGHLVGVTSLLVTGAGNDDYVFGRFRMIGSGPDAGLKALVEFFYYDRPGLSQPALAVDTALDRVYVAYAMDQSKLYLEDYYGNMGAVDYSQNLLSTPGWTVVGAPDIAVIGNGAAVVFKGKNGAAGTDMDPWSVTYNRGSTPRASAPDVLADNDWEDSVPHVATFLDGDASTKMWLAMWRRISGTAAYGDVYYSYLGSECKQVFDSLEHNNLTSFDLAGPQLSMATGVWIDQLAASDERLVPWVTYNTYNVSIPLVTSQ